MRIIRTYPSLPRCVAYARDAVTQFALRCGFYTAEAKDIQLAVGEACNNAVEHARSTSDFTLECEFTDDTLRVVIEDNGCGFTVGPLTPVHKMQPRGFGLHIMNGLVDHTEYIHKPGDGMAIVLEKKKTHETALV